MRFTYVVVTALSCACTLAAAGAAQAQPRQAAPITYAGQGQTEVAPMQTASLEQRLVGGDDRSYGYGATETRARGAVIDIRRSSDGARAAEDGQREQFAAEPEPAPQQFAQQGAQSTERPAWLEQERVGPPYEAAGQWYVPTPEPGYEQTGQASWYGPTFHGQATASGEVFDQEAMTAAHPTLPIPSLVQVTNLENGREIIVRVNDRGPFVGGRLIDLSRRSAEVLGFEQSGQARVHIRYLGPAPRHVNSSGATLPASTMRPAPAATVIPIQANAQDGPASLLPPSASTQSYAGAPLLGPTSAAAATGDFFVQVGAFADLSNAQRVRSAVAGAGPVNVDTRRAANGAELFRVRVGPFVSRAEAETARRTVANLGYGGAIVAAR